MPARVEMLDLTFFPWSWIPAIASKAPEKSEKRTRTIKDLDNIATIPSCLVPEGILHQSNKKARMPRKLKQEEIYRAKIN
jgi:hypothetical protein